MKKKTVKFNIVNNTDSRDIDEKSLGLSVDTSMERVGNSIYNDRGLHVQIRHNKNKKTFERACQLAKLIAAAPAMFEALESVFKTMDLTRDSQFETFELIRNAIKAANGDV